MLRYDVPVEVEPPNNSSTILVQPHDNNGLQDSFILWWWVTFDDSSWLSGNFSRPPTEAENGRRGPIVSIPGRLTGQAYLSMDTKDDVLVGTLFSLTTLWLQQGQDAVVLVATPMCCTITFGPTQNGS